MSPPPTPLACGLLLGLQRKQEKKCPMILGQQKTLFMRVQFCDRNLVKPALEVLGRAGARSDSILGAR